LSLSLRLREPLGERRISADALPLAVGGEGAVLSVPGITAGAVAAWIGIDDAGPVVETDPGAADAIRLNGRAIKERARLSHGDVLRVGDAHIFIECDAREARLNVVHPEGNETAPPIGAVAAPDEVLEFGPEVQTVQRVAFKPLIAPRPARRRSLHPGRWVIAAAIVVLVGALYFMSVSRSVQVLAEPATADVDFLGTWLDIGVADHYLLRPGSYTLVAENPGFEPARLPVTVTSEPNQQLRVTLKKLPGRVQVDTGGVAAMLTVDGKILGPVPGEYELAAGMREIALQAPRHVDFFERLEVAGGGESQRYEPKLIPAFSPVTIESIPAGARVAVDGRDLGATPLTTELDAGSYVLNLSASGFRRWEGAIQVQANTPQKIGPVELGLPDGIIAVRSAPQQADVAVAGRYRGRTPLDVALSPGVDYEINVSRAGYEPSRRVLRVRPGERVAMNVSLKPILGEVTVRGEPADAQVFVDGEPQGAANRTLSLPSAELTLEVRREGFQSYSTKLTPQPGFPRVVEYRLQTPEQAKAARMPATIRTRSGLDLKLITPGTFTMGSPRREPGRRANEAERVVTLKRPFYIGVTEVTNAAYRQFQPEHLSGIVRDRSLDQESHPVVNITWQQAAEYCNWLSAQEGLPPAYAQQGEELVAVTPATIGYRLPTEAEWEWSARYADGQAARRYPWGNSLPIAPKSGNFADRASLAVLEAALADYDDGAATTAPAGRYTPNPLGLFDFGGNVTEWVQDFYTVNPDVGAQSEVDPTGPATGTRHVVRGSSWRSASVAELRLAWRDYADGKAQHIGFRIARYAE
jgi:formylglycine-generating enzyme required for sulfatase activity